MAATVQDLEAEVLNLSPADRARLLEFLLETFEPGADVEAAWVAEAIERESQVLAGTVDLVPGGEALARARARLS